MNETLPNIAPYDFENLNPQQQEYFDHIRDTSAQRAFTILQEYHSKNTQKAHELDLKYWYTWLTANGWTFTSPITEKEIEMFITQHINGLDTEIDAQLVAQRCKQKLGQVVSLATIKRRIGSLSVFLSMAKWPNPCKSEYIKTILTKLTKKYGASQPAGKAITKDILHDMLDTCSDKLIDIRDKALLLFAWASGGRRRSEVAAADMQYLTKSADNNYVYKISHSKTDQDGKGYSVPVQGRAARALSNWLEKSNIIEGAIFRSVRKGDRIGAQLSDREIHRIVLRRLKMAEYNEKEYCAHSLRSGFVTEAGRQGKPLRDVMQMTAHKSIGTVMRYYQDGDIINNSAANMAD